MPFLTKEQILQAQDRKYQDVDVPEWGGTVRIASFDADQALRNSEIWKNRSEGANPISLMLAMSMVDEQGQRLFSDAEVAELGKKSPAVLSRLVNVVRDLNAKEMPDVGNTEATQGA